MKNLMQTVTKALSAEELNAAVAKRLQERQVPEHKARAMVKSIWGGAAYIALGLLFVGLAMAVILYVVAKLHEQPGLFVSLFAGGILLLGLYLVAAGGNLASGQALDQAAEHNRFFALLMFLVRMLRPRA